MPYTQGQAIYHGHNKEKSGKVTKVHNLGYGQYTYDITLDKERADQATGNVITGGIPEFGWKDLNPLQDMKQVTEGSLSAA